MASQRKTALIAVTSQDRIGPAGRPTGAYASEVADSWKVFSEAGFEVDLVSVQGGRPPLEAVHEEDPMQQSFFADERMSAKLAATPRPTEVDPSAYDILFLAGGHGAALDFPHDGDLAALTRAVYEGEGVVAAVCHGPAALVNVTLSDGSYLVAGKRVCCFSNAEERAVGMTKAVPFLLADELAAHDATLSVGPSFIPHIVTDGRLVTGQNPASATEVAHESLKVVSRSS
jgi:putative intracellular protease/amidase